MKTENKLLQPLRPRSSPPEPQLIPVPVRDGEGDDDQPPQGEKQRQRSRSRERVYPHEQVPQEPQIQPINVTPEYDDGISDEDFTIVDPSHNSPACCFMATLSWRKPSGPRITRRLWSNTRERTQSQEKEQAGDSFYPNSIEVMLRETARKSYPDQENIGNPMIAPQDYEVRQSGRVLELQNRDL